MQKANNIAEQIGWTQTDLSGANTAIRRQIYDAQQAGISPSLLFDKGTSGASTTSAGIDGANRMLSNVIQSLVNMEMNEDRLLAQYRNTALKNEAYDRRTEAQFDTNRLNSSRANAITFGNWYGKSYQRNRPNDAKNNTYKK